MDRPRGERRGDDADVDRPRGERRGDDADIPRESSRRDAARSPKTYRKRRCSQVHLAQELAKATAATAADVGATREVPRTASSLALPLPGADIPEMPAPIPARPAANICDVSGDRATE